MMMGTIARDGEKLIFEEKIKARLEADYWLRCINLMLKHTLRR